MEQNDGWAYSLFRTILFTEDISMNILGGLYFGSQIPFDEVDMDCPDYYKIGKEVEKIKAKMLNSTPI